MSDPNRPRQSPSGSQRWRDDDQRGPQRESRSSSRSQDDYTRPPSRDDHSRSPSRDGHARPSSHDDHARPSSRDDHSRAPGRDGGSSRTRGGDAGRYDDAPPRSPDRTRSARSDDRDDGWNDPKWKPDDRRPHGSRGSSPDRTRSARGTRDMWDDEQERAPRRHGSSVGVSTRRDDDGHGPRGWDDAGWQSDDGWDDAAWRPGSPPAHGERDARRGGLAREDDVWQPASQRRHGDQGRNNMAARAGAAWRNATSQMAAVVKDPKTFREKLRTDRKTQIIAAVMLAIILVCMVPTPILAYSNTMSLAKDGEAHLKNAENDFKALATSPTNLAIINNAQSELQLAHNDFAQLQLRVGVLTPIGFLPKIGSKVAGATKLVPLAVDGTQAGVLACDALKVLVTGLKNPLGTTGGLTSADTDQIASDMDQVHTLYGQMEPLLASLTQGDLSLDPGLWPTVSGLQSKLPEVNQLMDDMDGLTHALPQLLGVGKPATYLVLVLDSSELRPTGGFIGNFGALTLDSGRLDPGFHVSDITLIDSSVKFPAGTAPGDVAVNQVLPIPDKYSWLKTVFLTGSSDSWSLRDSNLDPDYPTAAKYALQLYPELLPEAQTNLNAQGSKLTLYDPAKSGDFAGVVTLSLGFFAQALGITGSIQVDDHTIHEKVTAQNFVSKIHEYALSSAKVQGPDSKTCGDTSCAKVFTSDVVKAFMAKVKANLSQYLGKMGKLFYDSLHTKDVEVYLTPQSAERTLQDLKVASTVQQPKAGGDTVFEVDANIGANKDNYFLQYQMADQVNISQAGDVTHKLGWSYRWPNNFCDPTVVFPAGNANYHSYSRVFTPPHASLISQSNLQDFGTDSASNDTFGLNVFHGAAYAPFPYCGTSYWKYGVSWKVPGVVTHDSAGSHYNLLFQREAGITWPLTLTVTLPSCVSAATPPVTSGLTAQDVVTVKGNVVTITGPLTDNEQFQFDWNC